MKTSVSESVLNKIAGLKPKSLLKKKLRQVWFGVNFAEFLKTPFSQHTSGRLFVAMEVAKDALTLN